MRFALPFLVATFVATSADAAIFAVDSSADAVDAVPGDGACASAAGACTLRAAVIESNALAGADEIHVPAGAFPLEAAGDGEDAAATGDLDVLDDLALSGAGAALTTIEAAGLERAFDFPDTGRQKQFVLSDVRLEGGTQGSIRAGSATDDGFDADGSELELAWVVVGATAGEAALLCLASPCRVRDSTIAGNATGDGIVMRGFGALSLERAVVEGHHGTGVLRSTHAASPWSAATLDIAASTIRNNGGAGVACAFRAGCSIADSRIEENAGHGVEQAPDTATSITGSVVRANQLAGVHAREFGDIAASALVANLGGGFDGGVNAVWSLEDTTVSGNGSFGVRASRAQLSSVTIAHNAGTGLELHGAAFGPSSSVVSSLLAANDQDCWLGDEVSGQANLIGDGTGCARAGDVADLVGVDPLLGALDGSDPMAPHHPLLPGSPAIDAGACATLPDFDQRGVSRPRDGDGNGEARCDIGAVEAVPEPAPTLLALVACLALAGTGCAATSSCDGRRRGGCRS